MANKASEDIRTHLFELQDEIYRLRADYRTFQARVIVVPAESIIGVRTPLLRKYAKELLGTELAFEFMKDLPHQYHEEKQLHSFFIGQSKDFDWMIEQLDIYLPYIDNWATCDSICPKTFKKHTANLMPHIERWMATGHTYSIRFAIECLMSFYLDDAFDPKQLQMVAAFSASDEYYVKMMVAWYFATAMAKQWDDVRPIMDEGLLADWTHNKAIQKAIESYRISPEQKEYLRQINKKKR